jgi:hypothetical protein
MELVMCGIKDPREADHLPIPSEAVLLLNPGVVGIKDPREEDHLPIRSEASALLNLGVDVGLTSVRGEISESPLKAANGAENLDDVKGLAIVGVLP